MSRWMSGWVDGWMDEQVGASMGGWAGKSLGVEVKVEEARREGCAEGVVFRCVLLPVDGARAQRKQTGGGQVVRPTPVSVSRAPPSTLRPPPSGYGGLRDSEDIQEGGSGGRGVPGSSLRFPSGTTGQVPSCSEASGISRRLPE